MGIKIDHTHPDGKTCYRIQDHYELTESSLFRLHGREFAAAYKPYTGSWYAFDLETGKEMAQFEHSFFEEHIRPFKVGTLTPDPDCMLV